MKPTPFLDAWRADLRTALAPRGQKTELARYLADRHAQSLHVWRVNLARLLRAGQNPGAEDLLAINHWLASRTAEEKKI